MLKRELGVFGATMMGLGSILGTGVFVSIGIAAGIAGPAVIVAIMIGALVAVFNGLNSAQLAANHPVSGGTYEYGYRYLNPQLGFMAGWTFLLAKSASAATAALGFSGYLLEAFEMDNTLLVPVALGAVILLTGVVLSGIRRSNTANVIIVSITLAVLVFFIVAGLMSKPDFKNNLSPFFPESEGTGSVIRLILHASALMFVAYTGYGRIATLGEEVRDPRRTIPRAIIAALIFTMILYFGVAIVSAGTVNTKLLGDATSTRAAPLEIVSRSFDMSFAPRILAAGAVTAMLGVLLNLILGLSRVLMAMGRRKDMPGIVARLNAAETTPVIAVVVIGAVITLLVFSGNVRTTWSFSAFTVLIYYAITNLAALRLQPSERLFPRWLAWCGLAACLFLAFWVDVEIWLAGLGLIVIGQGWRMISQRLQATP